MQRRNLITINWSTFDYLGPTSTRIPDYTRMGLYSGIDLDVSPDMQNPSVYALYVSPKDRDYDYHEYKAVVELPGCLNQEYPIYTLLQKHIAHNVYMANISGICVQNGLNTTQPANEYQKTQKLPLYYQITQFYPNAISSMFAITRSPAILHSFVERIRGYVIRYVNSLGFIDASTKTTMVEKLQSVSILVGAGLSPIDDCTNNSTLTECMMQQHTSWMNLIGQPVDPQRVWGMAATDANAYYSAQHNHIAIPYGIAEYPVFDPAYPDEFNLGGLGVIVAHEFIHSVDIQVGIHFEKSGQQHDWMPSSGLSQLTAYFNCVEDLYVQRGMEANLSQQSTGEIMADTFGTAAIFQGMKSPSSNSFLMFGQAFCSTSGYVTRAPSSKDPHATPSLRVNVSYSLLPSFQKTFGCSPISHPCEALLI